MVTVALKGLMGRKLRSVLTAFAIVLGVAMVSGTYILTDTINKGFNTIFTESYKNTDAVITGKQAFSTQNSGTGTISFPEGVLTKVRRLPDVAEAVGGIADQARLIGRNGKVIATGGSPGLAFSVDPNDTRFNPLVLTAGAWPRGPDQIAIDKSTASSKHFSVGDTIRVSALGPVRSFRITGIAKFASVDSLGGSTMALFDLPTAQKLFHKEGELDQIDVAARPGVATSTLVNAIKPVLPSTAQVKSGEEQAKSDSQDVQEGLNIFKYFLLAFGGIALFVGAFVIANTLAITVAQRMRELATLRTLGASRRQVLASVLLEALVVGIVASVIGLLLGLALAVGLNALLVSFGIDLPKSGIVFAPRTVLISLLVGVVITLLASLRPALRATGVPPIAAVREGAELPPSRLERFGPFPALAVLAVGILVLAYGIFAHGLPTVTRLLSLGIGCVVLFIGVALVSSRIVRPLAVVLGWPSARLGGAAGMLARENAARNPSRTASTAAALMIGLALVTLVAALGQGLRTSFEDAVNELFIADYALTAQSNFNPLTSAAAAAAATAPGVEVVSGVRSGSGRIFHKTIDVTGVDRNLSKVVDVTWYRGSSSVPAELGRDGAFVEKKYADDHDLSIGSPLRMETPSGKFLNLRLDGIFKAPKGGSPFGTITISNSRFDTAYPQPENIFTFINMRGGVTDANTAALENALRQFPDAKVQTQSQFKTNQEKPLNSLINLLYAMLGLSVIVSLFGIVNTLVLSVFERTRELGMLRAVGMTRRQVRRMIRQESIVTALIGAALGIVTGLFLAFLVTQALSAEGIVFAVPWGTLVVFVIVAIIAGILAAILPARRASRLKVLEALQYE